ncbi:MAG TPA: NAD-dependent succinate-semialdehyde dehydrogenase [Hyphomicrobiales bacterium]|nr:NAD-dependent succinate-semialdehyde dehydrogenase [Hyphomicrobiales bacterium]
MSLQSYNPATSQLIAEYPEMSQQELDAIITAADDANATWSTTPFAERAAVLDRVAVMLEAQAEPLALLMAQEMGKPLKDGRGEIEKCAWVCRYYAEQAETMLAPQEIASDATRSKAAARPLGTILAIMPWNFPFWQVFRFAAPTLMAGNTALLKHASNVSGCALAIEKLLHDAGLPQAAFRTLLVNSRHLEPLIAHPAIRAVSLTGSTGAGKAVAAAAGAQLKKCVLELGGSDPYVILDDADLAASAEICAQSRLINAGQSCIAAKRFIVVETRLEEFTELFLAALRKRRMGDPLAADTDFGPLARRDLRDTLHQQVQQSVVQGARLLLGGTLPEGPGAYYPATLLTDLKPGMPAWDEELFGPVAALIAAGDEDEALRLANASPFGLGSAIFTRDTGRGELLAEISVEAGSCFVNALVKSDPRLPFGGIRASGYGRELGLFGIREFVNVKTVYVA